MQNGKLLLLLTLMAALTALSIDIYLPSMPGLVTALQTDWSTVQLTLSVFVFAFAVGQLVYGPLSDRLGRRIPLLGGLGLYLVANLICAAAPGIEILLVGRFLQGLGACSGVVGCNAIVRDCFSGAQSTRAFARIASVTSLAPIIAPVIGGFLEKHSGWRASFLFLAGFSLVLLLLVAFKLRETLPKSMRGQSRTANNYREILTHKTWIGYSLISGLTFGALFAFIATSSDLIVRGLNISPQTYGILFATNAGVYLLGSFLAERLAGRVHGRHLVWGGSLLILAGGMTMAIPATLAHFSLPAVLLPMYIATTGVALAMPAAAAGAVEPFPHAAGLATGLQGFIRFVLAALIVVLPGMFQNHSAAPLALTITGCGLFSLISVGLITAEPFSPAVET